MLKVHEEFCILNNKVEECIIFTWSTGYLQITKARWNKLPKCKKNLIWELGNEDKRVAKENKK